MPTAADDFSRFSAKRASRELSKPAVLRWGEKRPSSWNLGIEQEDSPVIATVAYDEADGTRSVPATGKVVHAIDIWEDGEPRNKVQLVGGGSPVDDPFGDREELPPPREIIASPKADDPPRVIVDPEPLPLSPAHVRQPAEDDEPMSPTPAKPLSTAPCAPAKNDDRDCCAIGKRCKSERERLLKPSIRQISLDITPRFDADAKKTAEQVESDRVDRLEKAPSRAWKNIGGETIAEGRLSNYENGHVTIAGEGGQTLARVPIGELSEEDLCFLDAWWRLPSECLLIDKPEFIARCWVPSTFTWKASALCHKPLYFEHPGLERYGHTTGPIAEPFVSAAHFFVNIAMVPYHMGISPPNECEYALGYYRPGSCAPFLLPPFPISLKGALYEGAVVTGLVFFLP